MLKPAQHTDDIIDTRLRESRKASVKASTVMGLVRKYYDGIIAAKAGTEEKGKTWSEIAQDLAPDGFISGDTVGRAFSRVSAERNTSKRKPKLPKRLPEPAVVPDAHAVSQAAVGAEQSQVIVPSLHPFSAASDPIRRRAFED